METTTKTSIKESIDFLFEEDATPLNYQTLLLKMSAGIPLVDQDKDLLMDLHSFFGILQYKGKQENN